MNKVNVGPSDHLRRLNADPKLMEFFVDILSKDDPIMKEVWTHYYVHKRKEPIDAFRVQHFWRKLEEILADPRYVNKKGMA